MNVYESPHRRNDRETMNTFRALAGASLLLGALTQIPSCTRGFYDTNIRSSSDAATATGSQEGQKAGVLEGGEK
jgi:hypothetical protein